MLVSELTPFQYMEGELSDERRITANLKTGKKWQSTFAQVKVISHSAEITDRGIFIQ